MRKPTHVSKIRPGLLARLVGFRIVQRGEDFAVMKVPVWISDRTKQDVARSVCTDAALVGREIVVTVGDRYLRFEEPISR